MTAWAQTTPLADQLFYEWNTTHAHTLHRFGSLGELTGEEAVKLGLAAGPLVVSILLARVRRIGPLDCFLPPAAALLLGCGRHDPPRSPGDAPLFASQ